MDFYKDLSEEAPGQDLTFLAGIPYVYHCHHFNLFHDQTVEDALGEEQAFRLRVRAAQHNSEPLIRRACAVAGASTPPEKLQLISALFSWMGQGRLQILGDATGGEARGDFLHYSLAWREKYGTKVRRRFPVDAFAAGFSAAALEAAFDQPAGSVRASESSCYACREPGCCFELTRGEAASTGPVVDQEAFLRSVTEPEKGLGEAVIENIASGLKMFVAGAAGDERGLIQAFGLYITRHLSGYYDQTCYETIHEVEVHNPALVTVSEELFGESGHVCVFYTFGNILLSPEWEALVGKPKDQPEQIVFSCTAIARALGFGHWVVHELEPGSRLVLRSSGNYETPYYLQTYGSSDRPRAYFFANAARAFMQLAHGVQWGASPTLDEAFYQSLFKQDLQWRVEQTACPTRGDGYSEVVVSRGSAR